MYDADLSHDNPSLEEKLRALYGLNRNKALDLSFRPAFLELLEKMGNPHLNLPPTIHVAGTNGKGSTIAILESILAAHGKSVHRYTSPHLKRFNERIKLSGTEIDNDALGHLIDQTVFLNQKRDISFFEITTAMAFKIFSETPTDMLLLEVGLGGRLDCTNIIQKHNVSIINKISRDHCDYLGNTLPAITAEKAGIIKSNAPCVIGPQSTEWLESGAKQVIIDACAAQGAPAHFFGDSWNIESHGTNMHFRFFDDTLILPRPNLIGEHQIMNAGVALCALHLMTGHVTLEPKLIARGLTSINWPARLQRITNDAYPHFDIFYDGGHNDSAGDMLGQQAAIWADEDDLPLHVIIAMKDDKDPKRFLTPIAPHITDMTCLPLKGVGGYHEKTDFETAAPDIHCHNADTVEDALDAINARLNGTKARILITGSLYLADQIL